MRMVTSSQMTLTVSSPLTSLFHPLFHPLLIKSGVLPLLKMIRFNMFKTERCLVRTCCPLTDSLFLSPNLVGKGGGKQ